MFRGNPSSSITFLKLPLWEERIQCSLLLAPCIYFFGAQKNTAMPQIFLLLLQPFGLTVPSSVSHSSRCCLGSSLKCCIGWVVLRSDYLVPCLLFVEDVTLSDKKRSVGATHALDQSAFQLKQALVYESLPNAPSLPFHA